MTTETKETNNIQMTLVHVKLATNALTTHQDSNLDTTPSHYYSALLY